jgi:hypothetical protein
MTRRIAAVTPLPDSALRILWHDGATSEVDLGAVVRDSELFAPLRNAVAFADVRVVAYGAGVEWGTGELDFSADSLERLSIAQHRPRRAQAGD